MALRKIIFVVGPTAVGKTEVVFLLARKLKSEIISCDSMQVYKELSIATSKPSKQMLKAIPHHLIDVVSIGQRFDVATFRKRALRSIREIHQKNKIPLVVGGSGLYMGVLLDGIFEGGRTDAALRRKLEAQAKSRGNGYLYQKLEKVDPQAASRIHPHDRKRIIRALEVYSLNKQPISKLQKTRKGLWGKYDIVIFSLNRDREELYGRINRRVDEMFCDGMEEEIKRLGKRRWSQTARTVIGVREIQGLLKGEYDLEKAKDLIKLNTRHFAKRQLTWFRRDQRLRWVAIKPKESAASVAGRIFKEIRKHNLEESE